MPSSCLHPAHATLPRPIASGVKPPDSRKTAFTFQELTAQLQCLQPPVAYRLSLDCGVGYKNVRRALAQPMAIRLPTWVKLLRSLNMQLVVARRTGHPGAMAGAAPVGTCASSVMEVAGTLRCRRLALGWSRRALAERAGVGLDTVVSLEAGCGRVGTLSRVCEAMDLQLNLTLPPGFDSLEQLWEERSCLCLRAPAQFPPSRAQA